MIRVDAIGRMDVVYDEISEALGEEPGFFDAASSRRTCPPTTAG